jgi:protocatechuate 3,4-dioxygenase beta subunit
MNYNIYMNRKKDLERVSPKTKTLPDERFPETLAVEEGPYYKSGSPARTNLIEEGVPGQKIVFSGFVLDKQGKPISKAWLDFWQANGKGEYDNQGFTLRGHQYSDDAGRFTLETVIPGAYTGRTPHIHVKVKAGDTSPLLTTQLFIPGIDTNKNDFLYQKELLIAMEDGPGGKVAGFNFIVARD